MERYSIALSYPRAISLGGVALLFLSLKELQVVNEYRCQFF